MDPKDYSANALYQQFYKEFSAYKVTFNRKRQIQNIAAEEDFTEAVLDFSEMKEATEVINRIRNM